MSNNNGESAVTPTESETTGTVGHVPHGSRETPATSASPMVADRSEKARGHNADMYVSGESDRSIVPQKPANTDSGPLSAESVEGRGLTKEHVEQWLLDRTQRRVFRSRGLLGVRAAARPRRAGWSSPSKVRAVCGSAARTDLCGGWSAMTVPTAIVFSWQDRDDFGRKIRMPRRPRLAAGDLAYHVLNRRVGRLPLFHKPADYAARERFWVRHEY